MSMLDPRKCYTYFERHFQVEKTSNGWHKFDCPHCDMGRGKAKAAVKFEWGRVKCWECEMSYWVTDFIAWAEDITTFHVYRLIAGYDATDVELSYEDTLGIRGDTKVTLPHGFKGITSDGVMGKKARMYLENRGFDIDELDYKGFGYCAEQHEDYALDYFGYVIAPFKSKGELIWYQGRYFLGHTKMKFKNPPKDIIGIGKGDCIFNEDALYIEDINFIVEGFPDALTLGDMGISTQGWALSSRQRTLMLNSNASKFVFIPDLGSAPDGVSYYKKALQAARDFIDIKDTYVLDLREIATGRDKDVNDIGKMPVLSLFEKYESTPLTYTDIILKLL